MTVLLFSGGIGSWAAAHRLKAHGYDLTLLFTDTMIEDEDLYRFLDGAAADLELPVTRIADGRTPWELFDDEGMIGNTRADLCSRILKRDLARAWIDERWPEGTTVAVGMDWQEVHRYDRARPRWLPHELIAPMIEPPLLSKQEMIQWARDRGLEPPRLYSMGFPHNNCGGFCIKQGQGAFVNLLRTMPERYAEHEMAEERFRDQTGKDVSILRDRRDGRTTSLTLRQLRQEVEAGGEQLDLLEIGGCNCMI
jgi:3'-phosphoadenosine 5'-phosphosulfate sulfotransferase (PAPS reductase)/FAD synthetase